LKAGLGADDWAILCAYGFYLVDEGMAIGTLQNGFGMHTYWLSTMEVTDGLRVSFFSFQRKEYSLHGSGCSYVPLLAGASPQTPGLASLDGAKGRCSHWLFRLTSV
jgi:hypothetical protein